MYIFVYGSLKKGGINHYYLKRGGSEFISQYKLKGFSLCDFGHGFPYLVYGGSDSVYGEIYKVDNLVTGVLDRLEDIPRLYRRESVWTGTGSQSSFINASVLLEYYISHFDRDERYIVPNGYWDVGKSIKLKVIIDNRKYEDVAEKLVFHMRFFDGARTPTNKEYMKLVKARSKYDLNTTSESLFIRDCIITKIIDEF